jgi:hypothetical protein
VAPRSGEGGKLDLFRANELTPLEPFGRGRMGNDLGEDFAFNGLAEQLSRGRVAQRYPAVFGDDEGRLTKAFDDRAGARRADCSDA